VRGARAIIAEGGGYSMVLKARSKSVMHRECIGIRAVGVGIQGNWAERGARRPFGGVGGRSRWHDRAGCWIVGCPSLLELVLQACGRARQRKKCRKTDILRLKAPGRSRERRSETMVGKRWCRFR